MKPNLLPYFFTFLMVLSLPVMAQTATPNVESTTREIKPEESESNPTATVVDPDTIIESNIEQPLMNGYVIAKHYRKWTGKRVILSKAAQAIEISFNQEAPLTYQQAADLLVKTCFLEGLVFVPSGEDEVKLLPAGNVRKAGGYPLVINAEALPNSEELVTYTMHFDHIGPEDALSIFTGVIAQVQSHGSIVAVPNTKTLLITENSQLIRTLIEIKNRIDVSQELSTQKWVSVKHADAELTAENVRSIMDFSAKQNTQISAGGSSVGGARASNTSSRRSGNNQSRNRQRTTGGDSFSNVQIMADVRTNRIFVIGRPIDVEVAEGLIKGFDSPLDDRNYYKHKLKFLSVAEFLNTAQQAIQQATSKGPGLNEGRNGGRQSTQVRAGFRQSLQNARNPNASFGGSSSGGLGDSVRAEGPEAIIIGKTLLVADNSNNTLIINGPPQAIKVVKDLIREMDILTDQVQITAIFGRYNLNNSADFGFDFANTYQSLNGTTDGIAGQSRTGFPVPSDARALTDLAQFPNVSGFSIYGNIGKYFNATLRAMESEGKFKLMARPTVFTTNNRKATLSSGQQIAVPTNTFTGGGIGANVSQSTNIAFRDVLLELEVIPLVNSQEEVTLQISLTNNNVIGNTVVDGNEIPTIGQESIVTTVTVPNGDTIVLGGLITEREESSESGVPILRHIPGVKRLFSSVDKDVVREELLIFIQPRIINGKVQLKNLQSENAKTYQIAKDIQSNKRIFPKKFSDPEKQEKAKEAKNKRRFRWFRSKKKL